MKYTDIVWNSSTHPEFNDVMNKYWTEIAIGSDFDNANYLGQDYIIQWFENTLKRVFDSVFMDGVSSSQKSNTSAV